MQGEKTKASFVICIHLKNVKWCRLSEFYFVRHGTRDKYSTRISSYTGTVKIMKTTGRARGPHKLLQ